MTDAGPVAVVVGGGGPPDATRRDLGDLGDDPFVVAADEGLVHALALGLPVGAVVGDMDSVDPAALAAAEAGGHAGRPPPDGEGRDRPRARPRRGAGGRGRPGSSS